MTLETPDSDEPLALLWDAILSRQAGRIRNAYQLLDPASQSALSAHLRRMATEDGWHPEQQKSAQVALEAIRELNA